MMKSIIHIITTEQQQENIPSGELELTPRKVSEACMPNLYTMQRKNKSWPIEKCETDQQVRIR